VRKVPEEDRDRCYVTKAGGRPLWRIRQGGRCSGEGAQRLVMA
jgi:hypothetical protein